MLIHLKFDVIQLLAFNAFSGYNMVGMTQVPFHFEMSKCIMYAVRIVSAIMSINKNKQEQTSAHNHTHTHAYMLIVLSCLKLCRVFRLPCIVNGIVFLRRINGHPLTE